MILLQWHENFRAKERYSSQNISRKMKAWLEKQLRNNAFSDKITNWAEETDNVLEDSSFKKQFWKNL